MTEQKRNEIVSRFRAGASIRQIARDLGLARNTVSCALAQVQAQWAGADVATSSPMKPRSLDRYEPVIRELLGRYPELTAVRLLEELRRRGFAGGYTVVRQRLCELRPKAAPAPVVRFETARGVHYGKPGVMFGSLRRRACLT
jgi:transposase